MSDLPSRWEWATIGEVGHVMLGRQRSPKYHTGRHMRPYLRVKNVFENRIDLSDVMQMDFPLDQVEKFKLEPGDILLNEGQSPELIGRPAMFKGELPGACFTNSLIRFRPYDGIDGRYALYVFIHYLHSRRFRHEARITTNIAHLSARRFASIEFAVAPAAEQQRIVIALEEHLSRLEAAEAHLQAAEQRANGFQRAVMVKLFQRRDWPWITLGEIADVKGGITKDVKRMQDPDSVEVPYLRVANVQRGYIDLTEVAKLRIAADKARALRLEAGDVLFNEGGDRDKLGRGWVWEGEIPNCIHQNHVFRARLRTSEFDPYFVSTHANTWGQAWFEKNGRQTTNLASINLGILKTFPVPAPPRDAQDMIMKELDRITTALDAIDRALSAQRQRARSLRHSILSAAFSGKLVPQNPDDEPASVLLERIKARR